MNNIEATILKSILSNNKDYHLSNEGLIDIDKFCSDIKNYDKKLLNFLFSEELFLLFFTNTYQGFTSLDFDKIFLRASQLQDLKNSIDLNILKGAFSSSGDNLLNDFSENFNGIKLIDTKKIYASITYLNDILQNEVEKPLIDNVEEQYIKDLILPSNYSNLFVKNDWILDFKLKDLRKEKLDYSTNVFINNIDSFINFTNKLKRLSNSIALYPANSIKINSNSVLKDFNSLRVIKEINLKQNVTAYELLEQFMNVNLLNKDHGNILNNFLEVLIANLEEKRKFSSLFIYDDIPLEFLDEIILEDTANYLAIIKESKPRDYDFFIKKTGFNTPYKTYQEIADEYGLTRQAIEQNFKSNIKKLNAYFRIEVENLKKYIEKIISLNIDLNLYFSKLRKNFEKESDFFDFLENIAGMKYRAIYAILNPNFDMSIFEDIVCNKPTPYAKEEIIDIIIDDDNSYEKSIFLEYLLIFLEKEKKIKKIIIDGNEQFIPLKQTIPTMLAQALLFFSNGTTSEELFKKVQEIFDETIESRQNMSEDRYSYIYASDSGKYSHVSFFEKKYTATQISEILEAVYNYLLIIKQANIYQTLHYLKGININLSYYDLRHIVKRYGQSYSPSIFLFGKSSADIISLNDSQEGLSLKILIIEQIKKFNDSFAIKDLQEKLKTKETTFSTTFFSLLNQGTELSRVSYSQYAQPKVAFEQVYKDLNLKRSLINEIKNFFKINQDKPVTIAFLGNYLNNKFHLNFHKHWYLSFIRYNKKDFDYIYIFESNVLSLKNQSISLSPLVQNVYDKKIENLESYILDKILATKAEVRMAISSVISKQNNKE